MKHKHIKAILISVTISFLVLSGLSALILNYKIRRDKETYSYIVQNETDKIVTTVDCVMARVSTLKAFVQEHGGDDGFFDSIAENVYDSVREDTGVSLKNIAIAPDGVVSSVYPYSGNESLIGFDFMDMSREGNAEAREAYENGHTVLTNPFDLIQGGKGFAGRAPVIVKNGGEERLWGLVTVTIDYDNFIEVLNLKNFAEMGMNYELSFIDSEGARHVMDSYGTVGAGAVRKTFAVRNLTWELAIIPSSGWLSPDLIVITLIIIVTITFLIGVLTNMFFRLRDSNATLLYLSNTDGLTGCYNRRAFEEDLEKLALSAPDDTFICAAADVNGLKQTNDSLGHAAGDELLIASAEFLIKIFGSYGKVYRTGGDEFEILFSADAEQFEQIKEALQHEIDEWKGNIVKGLSFSIGYVARRECPDKTILEMVKAADERMYEEKRKYYQRTGIDRRNR